jgi:hypothetical protein
MRTLFLQAPSFDGFDGGAGARYQMRREIQSYWYPTWLAQPAALVTGSKLVDAPPHRLKFDDVAPEATSRDLDAVVLRRRAYSRGAQGAQAEFEDRHDRGEGRGRVGSESEGFARDRFRRPQ